MPLSNHNRIRIRRLAASFAALLLLVLLIPFALRPLFAALSALTLAPGDYVTITCPTGLQGEVQGSETVIRCAPAPTDDPTATPAYPEPTSTPSPVLPVAVPGRLEAENYAAWFDATPGNQGGAYRADDVDIAACADCSHGYHVGWIDGGEWLEYPIAIGAAGSYQIQARVAAIEDGKDIRFLLNGADVTGLLAVPGTGGWYTWELLASPVFMLPAGDAIIRVETTTGSFNLDAFDIVAAAEAIIPTATVEAPTATVEAPTATVEAPTATVEAPTATVEAPTATVEAPTATVEAPTATVEAPTATVEAPTATSAPPTATSAPPTATSAPPTATSAPPTATSAPPTATPVVEPVAVGTTYYVNASVGRDSNAGTSADAPWQSLLRVNSGNFKPGDQILFARGQTWYGTLTVPASGAPGKPIIFGAYGSGNPPVISGADRNGVPSQHNVIEIFNRQYVHLQDLTVEKGKWRTIFITNDLIDGFHELRRLTVRNGDYRNIEILNSGRNTVDSSIIFGGRLGEGVIVRYDKPPRGMGYNVISNNTIYDHGNPGIRLDGYRGHPADYRTIGNVAHHNTIYNNGDGIYLHYADRGRIYGNTIYDNNNTRNEGEQEGLPIQSSSGNDIYENVVYGHWRGGLQLWGADPNWNVNLPNQYGPCENNRIYRNTFHHNALKFPASGIYLSEAENHFNIVAYNLVYANGYVAANGKREGAGIALNSSAQRGNVIVNNTVVGNLHTQMHIGTASTTVRNNLISDDGFTLTNDRTGRNQPILAGDPRFVNPAAADYHLRAGSPAIGAGLSLADLSAAVREVTGVDRDGKPVANPRSVGAYEP